jgi:hypothetical protein
MASFEVPGIPLSGEFFNSATALWAGFAELVVRRRISISMLLLLRIHAPLESGDDTTQSH